MPVQKQQKPANKQAVQQNKKAPTAGQKQPKADQATRSKADLFDSTMPQGQTAPGKYEALLVEAVLQDAAENGSQAVRFAYEIANEGDFQGNRVVQFYNIYAEGSTEEAGIPGRGIEFLKKDLSVLGYNDVSFADLEEALDKIAEEKPDVIITGKQNGAYYNVYLNSLAEGSDMIEQYRESRGA